MHSQTPTISSMVLPYLEHYPEHDGPVQLVVCERFPFRIGRSEQAECVIYSNQVSKYHAAIECCGDAYTIRDLGSTNGTYVNGARVTESPLRDGDIIHIAHKEFRFSVMPEQAPPTDATDVGVATTPVQRGEQLSVIHGRAALQEVLIQQHVRVLFQRIVDLTTEETVGHEALGRGTHEQLSPNPAQLFHLAEKCGLATQLSRLFRIIAFREAKKISGAMRFFFNVHPTEMEDKNFVNSLEQAMQTVPKEHRLVMEVHEDCVSDVSKMRRLRDRLHAMRIDLAYDDFGAGQSRLAELAEVPPDFLKIDMSLIRGIDQSAARQDIVGALTDSSARLGVRVLAEGVETTEEADCCRRLGCHWAQGYLFGRPIPSATIPQNGLANTKPIDRILVEEPLPPQ